MRAEPWNAVTTMYADIGDEIIVESGTTDRPRRDGEIVGLHHADGSPPYDVCWEGSEHESLVFPGPDAHIRHAEHRTGGTGSARRSG